MKVKQFKTYLEQNLNQEDMLFLKSQMIKHKQQQKIAKIKRSSKKIIPLTQ